MRHPAWGRLVLGSLWLALAVWPGSTVWAADAARAKELYKQGSTYFTLGKFDKAITAWEAGYEARPDPQFLYNIGQAHRLAGNAAKAIFFYKGFLREAPDAPNRADVEQKIAKLQAELDAAAAAAVAPPPVEPVVVAPPPAPEPVVVVEAPPPPRPEAPTPQFDLGVGIGGGRWTGQGSPGGSLALQLAGGLSFGPPTRPTRFRLGGRVGMASAGEQEGTARFWSLLAVPTVVRDLSARFSVSGELGLGLVAVTGLRPGSAFLLRTIVETKGVLATLEVRPAVQVSYRLNARTMLFLSPALAYGVRRSAYAPRATTRVELLAGAAWQVGGGGAPR